MKRWNVGPIWFMQLGRRREVALDAVGRPGPGSALSFERNAESRMTGNGHVWFGGGPPQKYVPIQQAATRRRPPNNGKPKMVSHVSKAAPRSVCCACLGLGPQHVRAGSCSMFIWPWLDVRRRHASCVETSTLRVLACSATGDGIVARRSRIGT